MEVWWRCGGGVVEVWWWCQVALGVVEVWWRCGGGGRRGGVHRPIELGDGGCTGVPYTHTLVQGVWREGGDPLPPSSTWCRWGGRCRSRSRSRGGRRTHWSSRRGCRGRWGGRGCPVWWGGRWSRSRPPCLVAGRSLPIPLPLGRALVARAVGRRRRRGRRGRRGKREGGVRVAQAEVVANPHGATRGVEVQGGGAPHAPHRQELPQGGLEEVHTGS